MHINATAVVAMNDFFVTKDLSQLKFKQEDQIAKLYFISIDNLKLQ